MKNLHKISTVLFLFLMIFGCSDRLNLEPVSSISNSSFWKTGDDASGLLYGMYDRLRVLADNNSILYWGEGRGESMDWSFGTGPNIYWENLLDRNNAGEGWQGLYTVVHHANLLIKHIPNIDFTNESEKMNILAQAHAMRAYIYFWIVRIWGDAILFSEPIENFNPESIQKERTPVIEVFDFIKSDLENSLSLFQNNTIPSGRFVWSKPAVNTLKAEVYLWTAKLLEGGNPDLQTALSALEGVENADTELLGTYEEVFDYENKGNKEVLFALRFEEFEVGDNWGREAYLSPTFYSNDFDQETIDRLGALPTGGSTFTVSKLVRDQFHILDQRRNATFIELYTVDNSGEKHFYGSCVNKYDGTVIGGVRRGLDDIIIYRYADVLLLKAEVKNALGQDPSDEINQIRNRAYGPHFNDFIFSNKDQERNDDVILKERLLEFTYEGKRWFDLIRFGKAFDLVPSLQDKKGQNHLLLFPISETTLSLEPGVSQNPGY